MNHQAQAAAPEHAALLQQILELLDTACQASLELLDRYAAGDLDAAKQLIADLYAVTAAVQGAQKPLLPRLEHAYTTEMLENVVDTLDDIQSSVQAGNNQRAAMKMEFQLFPFLRQLREAFYFWGEICPDNIRMERYYQEEFAENFRNPYVQEGETPPFDLSIVVPAYNHLDTTKRCIDQLLKETDFKALNAELILIDHGSTDGTLEYFESLGAGKVIHFKHNVRMYMVTAQFQICQGKYLAFVSNDVLVTKDWASLLQACMDSDPNIIAAVPTTPNISNFQPISFPTDDPDEFVAWANEWNRSNPSMWNDRARLMPPLGLYRIGAVNGIGFADPYFYSREYYDDDFSLRARRAGYRQVVCNDVACYHFGSVTGKAAQASEGTLLYGRDLFKQKNGVNPWGNGFCYDNQVVHIFKQMIPLLPEHGALLGLDCGMGDTLFQLQNELRHQQKHFEYYHLTCEKAYFPDLEHFSTASLASSLTEGLASAFGPQTFSAACLNRDIAEYADSSALLTAIENRLEDGGWLIFFCGNPFYARNLYQLLQFTLPEQLERWSAADPARVQKNAEAVFRQVQVLPMESPVKGQEAFARKHYGSDAEDSKVIKQLTVSRYYFVCQK